MAKESGRAAPKSGDANGGDFKSERLGKIPIKPVVGTAIIADVRGRPKPIRYIHVDGFAVVEGDIVLGSIDEVEQWTTVAREHESPIARLLASGVDVRTAVAITSPPEPDNNAVGITSPNGQQYRWQNGTIPWEIDPELYDSQRVVEAIDHWKRKTWLQFPTHTTEADWVYFTYGVGCASHVGRQGGKQLVVLGRECSVGNVIHEIAHTVGLWHEQSREDRDRYVKINYQNIQSGMESQFSQHITDGDDIGTYDYESIMHYPRNAFSRNDADTVTPVRAGVQIGQREGLSPGDIAAVRKLYPAVFKKFGTDASDAASHQPNHLLGSQEPASIAEELKIQLLEVEAQLQEEQSRAAQSALAIAQLQATRDDLDEAYRNAVVTGKVPVRD